jgi:hypothetical protein
MNKPPGDDHAKSEFRSESGMEQYQRENLLVVVAKTGWKKSKVRAAWRNCSASSRPRCFHA